MGRIKVALRSVLRDERRPARRLGEGRWERSLADRHLHLTGVMKDAQPVSDSLTTSGLFAHMDEDLVEDLRMSRVSEIRSITHQFPPKCNVLDKFHQC